MGYYSRHELSIEKGDYNAVEIARYMHDQNKKTKAFYPFIEEIKEYIVCDESDAEFELSDEESKWYDQEEEMECLSTQFPDVIFKVHRKGEESGDICDSYYRNGKSVTYEAVMPSLNEEDLK